MVGQSGVGISKWEIFTFVLRIDFLGQSKSASDVDNQGLQELWLEPRRVSIVDAPLWVETFAEVRRGSANGDRWPTESLSVIHLLFELNCGGVSCGVADPLYWGGVRRDAPAAETDGLRGHPESVPYFWNRATAAQSEAARFSIFRA